MSDLTTTQEYKEFPHGTVVALKTHFFNKGLYTAALAGSPLNISPLMIVVEQLGESRTVFNDKTGEELSTKGAAQCRCMWFSTKRQEFVDAWFPSKVLKAIEQLIDAKDLLAVPERDTKLSGYQNKLVIFRTARLEVQKKKSSTLTKGGTMQVENLVPILNYVSPEMQIIQITEFRNLDQKEGIYDAKNGDRKRFFHQWVAKCKYFNSETEKFVEKLIPLDCLQEITKLNETILHTIQDTIKKNKYLSTKKSIIKPYNLAHLNGEYILRGYDYLSNKVLNIILDNSADFEILDNYFSEKAKRWDPETAEICEKKDLVKKGIEEKKYIAIKYAKGDDEVSNRTLSEFELINAPNSNGKATDYLIGFDHTRKAKRTFLLKRVKNIKLLNLLVS